MPGKLTCTVVTPEQTALQTEADFVALPLYDGEIGIAPRHTPLIGRLGFGELRIVSGGTTRSFYVDGGFVQVADDQIAVMTDRAVPAAALDVAAAEKQLAAALSRPALSPQMMEIRDRQIAQARAQMRTARRGRM
jgi:F-type H+-transporting ATPase subunit epsilon